MSAARIIIAIGAVTALLGVGIGAMGAHALGPFLDARGESLFDLAARYHLLHALGVVATGLAARGGPTSRLLPAAAAALLAGVCLFSGSLYAMALGAPRWLGAVTPVGGLAFMAGWLLLAIGVLRGDA